MNLRDALIQQAPSLELQRASLNEIARLDAHIKNLHSECGAHCLRIANLQRALGDLIAAVGSSEARDHGRTPLSAQAIAYAESLIRKPIKEGQPT